MAGNETELRASAASVEKMGIRSCHVVPVGPTQLAKLRAASALWG